jgi:omega-6 fatty acid desaturase (delta-12 desaturase)
MNTHKDIKLLKPSDKRAFSLLIVPLCLIFTGAYASFYSFWSWQYLLSQIVLGLFFFQCFILLHETGHFSFFKSRLLNRSLGHICAFISFIPFESWVGIHNLHHKWTGYRDKDPTTEGTVSPKFGIFKTTLVNICWKLWIPLFTIGYRIGNYWNIGKIKKHVSKSHHASILGNMIIMFLLYTVTFYFFGKFLIEHFALGFVIGLMISDVFILSQHSHIEIPLAGNKKVKPLKYADQVIYTRTVDLNRIIAKYVYFNFNKHELHHAYPGLAAYHLDSLEQDTPNHVDFFSYLNDAKRLSGIEFIFNTSKKKIGSSTSTLNKSCAKSAPF